MYRHSQVEGYVIWVASRATVSCCQQHRTVVHEQNLRHNGIIFVMISRMVGRTRTYVRARVRSSTYVPHPRCAEWKVSPAPGERVHTSSRSEWRLQGQAETDHTQ